MNTISDKFKMKHWITKCLNNEILLEINVTESRRGSKLLYILRKEILSVKPAQ